MNYAKPDPRLDRAEPASPPVPAVPPPSAAHEGRLSPRWRRRLAWLGPAASLVLFVVALAVLYRLVSQMSWSDLRAAVTAAGLGQVGLAAGLTAASYLLLTCYDALALRQLKLSVPYRTTAFASFASYAVSFNLGFPLVTGGTVRYWIYAPKGLSAAKVASLTVIAGFTFWLGMGLVLGTSLLAETDDVSRLTWTNGRVVQLVGLASLAAVAAYLAWVSLKRRSVRVKGWRLELPGLPLTIGQMLIGTADVLCAAGVLYVLLPDGHGIGFPTFLAIYVFAAMLGIVSHAPGGLGVFEATILLALSGVARESVLGALLLFRVFYYLVPFVVALAGLGLYEITGRLRAAREWGPPDEE
jgi:glycosyltransferase 2 family protein